MGGWKTVEQRQKWRDANREKLRAQERARHAAHPERSREKHRRHYYANLEHRRAYAREYQFRAKFGITLADKKKLLADQGGKCAICRSDKPGSRNGWALDHCHKTKSIRGVLCAPCNLGLGGFKDSVRALTAAVKYLQQGKTP